jgi:hypothetical protein
MKSTVHSVKFSYTAEIVNLQEAKLIRNVPEPSELALDDIHVSVDDDTSV